jgi:hypothetical protein
MEGDHNTRVVQQVAQISGLNDAVTVFDHQIFVLGHKGLQLVYHGFQGRMVHDVMDNSVGIKVHAFLNMVLWFS